MVVLTGLDGVAGVVGISLALRIAKGVALGF
jgi:hypothetical protein